MILGDIENDVKHKQAGPRKKVGSLEFASGAGFPIKAKDKVIGVLHLANKVKRHLARDELQLIESIAQEIGVAAENAQLLNK